jgi:nucleotide-binding universal stress UspA family protein
MKRQSCCFHKLFAAGDLLSSVGIGLAESTTADNVGGWRLMAVQMFRKILMAVDFSPCSDVAFGIAIEIARAFDAELTVAHVIDTSAVAAFNRLGLLAVPSDATAQRRRLRHQARFKTRQLLESQSTTGLVVRRIVLEGTPFIEIAKLAREERIDLIVLGSYGGRSESMDKIFFGATAEKVVRTAGCAVLTVPLPARKVRKDIVL